MHTCNVNRLVFKTIFGHTVRFGLNREQNLHKQSSEDGKNSKVRRTEGYNVKGIDVFLFNKTEGMEQYVTLKRKLLSLNVHTEQRKIKIII